MRSIWHSAPSGDLGGTLVLAAAGTAVAQTVIKVGHDQPDRSTHHQAALKWKELVEHAPTARSRCGSSRR